MGLDDGHPRAVLREVHVVEDRAGLVHPDELGQIVDDGLQLIELPLADLGRVDEHERLRHRVPPFATRGATAAAPRSVAKSGYASARAHALTLVSEGAQARPLPGGREPLSRLPSPEHFEVLVK